MPPITLLDRGWIDHRDSAFPQAARFADGQLVCAYCVGGGPNVHGGSDISTSLDNGATWEQVATILPKSEHPAATNHLKVSLAQDGQTLLAYGARMYRGQGEKFGQGRTDAIVLRSGDRGKTWSSPTVLANPYPGPLEISFGVVPLDNGNLLAPAATLSSSTSLGERVIGFISEDGGLTWNRHVTVLKDPHGQHGYFEHKFAKVAPGRLLAVAWTVTLGEIVDQENHFAWSDDNGETWSAPRSTGVMGQTMTPIHLAGDTFLVLYNRRYGHQGIVMQIVTITDSTWNVDWEGMLYDAGTRRDRPGSGADGIAEFDDFAFGFPTAISLADGTILATFWCKEDGLHGVRWQRLQLAP